MSPRGRRWRRLAIIAAIVIAVAALAIPPLLRTLVTRRLQALVAAKLDAHLVVGKLTYRFPYGVIVTDALIVAQSPDGTPLEMLGFGRLELRLAQLPFGQGPIAIESISIDHPSVRLIRTADGFVGERKSNGSNVLDAAAQASWKLSNILRLTHLQLHAGRFQFEDRTRAKSVPLVWNDLNLSIDTQRQSASGYRFQLAIDNAPMAKLDASGVADVDALLLQLDKCALTVTADPSAPQSALPSALQESLRQWQPRGVLHIDLGGSFPMREPTASTYRTVIELEPSSARLPGTNAVLDRLAFRVRGSDGSEEPLEDGSRPAPGARPFAKVELLDAQAGDTAFHLERAVIRGDLRSKTWNLSSARGNVDSGRSRVALPPVVRNAMERLRIRGACDFTLDYAGPAEAIDLQHASARLTLHPRGFSMQLPGLDQPVTDVSDTILTLANGELAVSPLRGSCGKHLLFVKEAHVTAAGFPGRIHAHDLSGCLTLGAGGTFPGFVSDVLTPLQPAGPFFFSGNVDVDLKTPVVRPECNLKFHTTRSRMSVGPSHIPVSGIDANATLTSKRLVLERLVASTLEGAVDATGAIEFGAKPSASVKVNCRSVNLKLLADGLAKPSDKPMPLSGRGNLTADLNASLAPGTSLQSAMNGSGDFEVRDGNFWKIPVMNAIAHSVSRESVTVGEAAGIFHIRDGRVHFDRAVASAPLLGVQGSGDFNFDGKLDFKLVADLFGKWGDRVGDGDGGGVAKIVGAVQQGIDVATRQALYEVTVTGNASDPRAGAVPVPFITRNLQKLFNTAADPNRKGGLLGPLHENGDAAHPQ